MSYLDMSETEIHDVVECTGLDDDMFFSLHHDATKKIDELKSVIRSFVEWETDPEGKNSLVDDESLWSRAEEAIK